MRTEAKFLKDQKKVLLAEKEKMEAINQSGPKLTASKLQDLAWSLDVLDSKKKESSQS